MIGLGNDAMKLAARAVRALERIADAMEKREARETGATWVRESDR